MPASTSGEQAQEDAAADGGKGAVRARPTSAWPEPCVA